jgi:conjugative relaxase-like TrwC/TraI family protein
VKDTMKWAEANLAEARIKVDGKDVAVRTGNLVYALFQHDTSRATDPQSHIHAVIANLTQLPYRYRNHPHRWRTGEGSATMAGAPGTTRRCTGRARSSPR